MYNKNQKQMNKKLKIKEETFAGRGYQIAEIWKSIKDQTLIAIGLNTAPPSDAQFLTIDAIDL